MKETRGDMEAARQRLGQLQSELDDLGGEYMRAERRLYEIDQAIEATSAEQERTRADLETIQGRLSGRVVDIYKNESGKFSLFLEALLEEPDFLKVINRWRQLSMVAEQDNEVLDQIEQHGQRLDTLQVELDGKRVEQKQGLSELQQAQARLESRLNATAAEYRRLKQQVAKMEEEARRAAEARRQAAARASSRGAQSSASRASGGTVVRGFVFPVAGPHSYINDWGFARSGGRTHKGTDVMAPRGTPTVACVSGTISRTSYGSGLGGTTIWLRGSDGNSYYYAHLDSIAGGIGPGVSVSAGQTIGSVGSSGNARGGAPHLHFEIHPGGGAAVNPYPTLRASE